MIQAKGLVKRFDNRLVLDGVEFEVEPGDSAVILGPSGAGKSVLLKILIGLIRPEAGEVWVDGQAITRLEERELLQVRRQFGLLFQGSALFDSMTVEENIAFGLRKQARWEEKEVGRRVRETLELVGLSGTESLKPAELSGGMRKRVGLARAIAYRPRIILYDEPTTGLDPITADSIDELIVQICSELRVTSIAVTHDLRSARRIARRFFFLHDGTIRAEGSAEDIFCSEDPIVKRFVSSAFETSQPLCPG